jgi:hypothetical protein
MKRFRITTALLIVCMLCVPTIGVFAQGNEETVKPQTDIKIKKMDFEKKDPIKELENIRKEAQEQFKKGRLSKEELDSLTAKIDKKVKAVKEFKKLPLEQKKDVLINNFTRAVYTKVQKEWITVKDKEALIEQFSEEVNEWDGVGFPTFYHQGVMLVKKKMHADHEEHHMHMYHKVVAALDKAVKAGTITEKQKEEILIYVRGMMKDMK